MINTHESSFDRLKVYIHATTEKMGPLERGGEKISLFDKERKSLPEASQGNRKKLSTRGSQCLDSKDDLPA